MQKLKAVYELESTFRVVTVEDSSVNWDQKEMSSAMEKIVKEVEAELSGETWTAVIRQEQQG
ncbi:MAG TPA: hypothetical protein VLH08_08530 [Acidobacteriota bacterium]|nr:hypothetical protein [Acidobacteriota bacterium]